LFYVFRVTYVSHLRVIIIRVRGIWTSCKTRKTDLPDNFFGRLKRFAGNKNVRGYCPAIWNGMMSQYFKQKYTAESVITRYHKIDGFKVFYSLDTPRTHRKPAYVFVYYVIGVYRYKIVCDPRLIRPSPFSSTLNNSRRSRHRDDDRRRSEVIFGRGRLSVHARSSGREIRGG